jgi:hypothetical protein
MGADGTRKRQWAAENSLVGPASRALATPPRAPRPRLPSLQGSAFDEEERCTDSEIDNVLGGIQSVPPKPLGAPVIAASEAADAPASPEPPLAPPPDEWPIALHTLRKRQLMVLTAACAFVAIGLALTAALRVAHGRAAPEDPQQAATMAPAPPATASIAPAAVDGLPPAATTVPPSAVTAQTPAAAPQNGAASRRPPSKRGHRPGST